MYTEKQLVSFGNYLLQRYKVMVHSNDGNNTPLYQRGVTDADHSNWLDQSPAENAEVALPATHQIKSLVNFRFTEDAPFIPARVLAVHFFASKVRYDLTVLYGEDEVTRVYNIDSCFVSKSE